MKRILFVTVPERGHYHVLLGPAQQLVAMGHRVAFWSARRLRLSALPEVTCYGEASDHEANRGPALAALLDDPARLRAWIRALLLDGVEAQLAQIERAIADFSPDVIACDPMIYAAPIAAARAKLPWAALSSSLNPVLPPEIDSELLATVRSLASDRDALFARHGIRARFSGCDCLSPHATLVFATDAFVSAAAGVELVGPSRGDRGEASIVSSEDIPLVYASLGSQNWYQPELIARLVDAVRDRPLRVIISAGGLADSVRDLPANVTIVPYADQCAVLRSARLFITHGGANSVIEGLDAGVPLLVTPLVNDQPHNAWFVERAGAGRALRIDRAEPSTIWAHITALLENGPERKAAARIQASFQSTDGARTAALRIAAL